MMVHCDEMDELIVPFNWEPKPYDLKMINDLTRNHPYQKIMFLVYKYYCSYVDEFPGDILYEIDYFKLLDIIDIIDMVLLLKIVIFILKMYYV